MLKEFVGLFNCKLLMLDIWIIIYVYRSQKIYIPSNQIKYQKKPIKLEIKFKEIKTA